MGVWIQAEREVGRRGGEGERQILFARNFRTFRIRTLVISTCFVDIIYSVSIDHVQGFQGAWSLGTGWDSKPYYPSCWRGKILESQKRFVLR